VVYEYADGFRGALRAWQAANKQPDVIVALRTDEQGLFCDWERLNDPNLKIFYSSGQNFQSRFALTAAMMKEKGQDVPGKIDVPFKMKQVAEGLCNPVLPGVPTRTLVIAKAAREMGILTVGVVTKPFHFESGRRMKVADAGIAELQETVDMLIIIPNQNLFRIANEKTTFTDAFAMADRVLYSGVACVADLIVKEGLINLDFADVRSIMGQMGRAMLGTGEATGERRAVRAAEAAISNPLLDDISMRGAGALLISITGGDDLTLCDVDEAASRIRQEIDDEANIILDATFEPALDGVVRVSVVAAGVDQVAIANTDVETEPLLGPGVPFPEPIERRGVPAPHRSLLERLKTPLRLAS
jgi:hypothetical protein